MRHKLFLKAAAMLLSISMAATLSSVSGLASTMEQAQPDDAQASAILGEIENQRTEYSKTFERADGSFVTVVSAAALHYQQDGAWEEIDNTLEVGAEGITNRQNEIDVEFPATLDAGEPVSVSKGGYEVSFALLTPIHASDARIHNSGGEAPQTGDEMEPYLRQVNKTARVDYQNVAPNTDIVYDLSPKKVKESIVLSEKPGDAVDYTYRLEVDGLTARLVEDNSVEFLNTWSQRVFTMPAPFMTDSEGDTSYAVSVSLTQAEDGSYELTYLPSSSWLEEADYPVTIDPTVQSSTGVQDTFVESINSSYNYSKTPHIEVENHMYAPGLFYDRIGLIKFTNLPYLGRSGILSAHLNMTPDFDTANWVYAHKVTSTWDASTVNWNTRPSYNSTAEAGSVGGDSYNFDLSELVTSWYEGEENNGVALIAEYQTQVWLMSSESETPPYLTINYFKDPGFDMDYSLRAQSAGSAGTAYINNFTGKVYLEAEDYGFNDGEIPVQIKRIYDPEKTDTQLVRANRWRLNYDQFIQYDADAQTYTYSDDTTREIVFDRNSSPDFSLNQFRDNRGLGYEIMRIGNELSMTDSGGLTYYFTYDSFLSRQGKQSWSLVSITDYNKPGHPQVTINRDTNNYISEIIDTVGRRYQFFYEMHMIDQGLKYMICRSNDSYQTQIARVDYTVDRGELTTVTRNNAVIASYDYGANTTTGGLTLTASDQSKIGIIYGNGGKVFKVERFNSEGHNEYFEQIDYYYLKTKVIDSTGVMHTFTFNTDGKPI